MNLFSPKTTPVVLEEAVNPTLAAQVSDTKRLDTKQEIVIHKSEYAKNP